MIRHLEFFADAFGAKPIAASTASTSAAALPTYRGPLMTFLPSFARRPLSQGATPNVKYLITRAQVSDGARRAGGRRDIRTARPPYAERGSPKFERAARGGF